MWLYQGGESRLLPSARRIDEPLFSVVYCKPLCSVTYMIPRPCSGPGVGPGQQARSLRSRWNGYGSATVTRSGWRWLSNSL